MDSWRHRQHQAVADDPDEPVLDHAGNAAPAGVRGDHAVEEHVASSGVHAQPDRLVVVLQILVEVADEPVRQSMIVGARVAPLLWIERRRDHDAVSPREVVVDPAVVKQQMAVVLGFVAHPPGLHEHARVGRQRQAFEPDPEAGNLLASQRGQGSGRAEAHVQRDALLVARHQGPPQRDRHDRTATGHIAEVQLVHQLLGDARRDVVAEEEVSLRLLSRRQLRVPQRQRRRIEQRRQPIPSIDLERAVVGVARPRDHERDAQLALEHLGRLLGEPVCRVVPALPVCGDPIEGVESYQQRAVAQPVRQRRALP